MLKLKSNETLFFFFDCVSKCKDDAFEKKKKKIMFCTILFFGINLNGK